MGTEQTSEIVHFQKSILQKAFLPNQFEKSGDNVRPKNQTNYVGIVNVDGRNEVYSDKKLFKLSTDNSDKEYKVPAIFDMFNFAVEDSSELDKLLDVFLFDHSKLISIKAGQFDNLLPSMFIQELEKVLREGLLKTYVLKRENVQFARGKIDIKGQIQNEFRQKPKLACIFWDMTTNDFFNQAILKATTRLIEQTKVTCGLKSKLAICASKLRQEFIDDVEITPANFSKFRYIPKRYVDIVKLAEAVINRHYHSVSLEKEVSCPSFMINMAVVWESFLRSAIRKKFRDLSPNFEVEKKDIDLEIFNPVRTGIPDIVLYKEPKCYVIIDVKYKNEPASQDFYQLAAYLGSKFDWSKPKTRKLFGIILCLGEKGNKESTLPTSYLITDKDSTKKLQLPIHVMYLYEFLIEKGIEQFCNHLYNEIKRKL